MTKSKKNRITHARIKETDNEKRTVMSKERVPTFLVTYDGEFTCEVAKEDVEKLDMRESGTFVTLYNLREPKNSKLLERKRTIETSSIVSRLY